MRVPIQKTSTLEVALPEYLSPGAAGMDLPAAIAQVVTLQPREYRLIPCGFALAIPHGFEGQIRPRSGLASRHGVTVLNAPGTIDCDYRGEVRVLLINHGAEAFTIAPGMRVAQLVISPVAHVEWDEVTSLPDTERGTGGFGHTGA